MNWLISKIKKRQQAEKIPNFTLMHGVLKNLASYFTVKKNVRNFRIIFEQKQQEWANMFENAVGT